MEQQQINLVDMKKILLKLSYLKQEVDKIKEVMADDLEFARRTDKAWESYDKGEFISQPADKFLEDLEKC